MEISERPDSRTMRLSMSQTHRRLCLKTCMMRLRDRDLKGGRGSISFNKYSRNRMKLSGYIEGSAESTFFYLNYSQLDYRVFDTALCLALNSSAA